jgi:V/A-type H+-transporting ATPase subunit D
VAKVKHTKNELKAQREALRRFDRFLPMLQLKKQQLQIELRHIEARMDARRAESAQLTESMRPWVRLASLLPEDARLVTVKAVRTGTANIAGIAIPTFVGIDFDRESLDLFSTPAWYDNVQEALEAMIAIEAELAVLEEQHRLVSEEWRTTSQRVNLFEKVKIPECRENIRVIRIFLGDEQAAGVARAKFAKGRAADLEQETAAALRAAS